MKYSIAEIRRLDLTAMRAAEQTAETDLETMDEVVTDHHRSMSRLLAQWHSDAAEEAGTSIKKTVRLGDTLVRDLRLKVREIGLGASALADARDHVLTAVAETESAGYDVDEATGEVTAAMVVMPGIGAEQVAADRIAKIPEWQGRIDAALDHFAAVDEQVATALGGAPDATDGRVQAITAQVDAGHILNGKAALQIPWQLYTKAGREALASWTERHPYVVRDMVENGEAVNLPPWPNGYRFEVTEYPTPTSRLMYAIEIAGGTGVSALTITGSRNGRPSLSGTLNGGSSTAAISDEGWSMDAVHAEHSGETSLGIKFDDEGAWLSTSHKEVKGDSSVSETFEVRPEAPRLDTPWEVAQQAPEWVRDQWEAAGREPNTYVRYGKQGGLLGLAVVVILVVGASPALGPL